MLYYLSYNNGYFDISKIKSYILDKMFKIVPLDVYSKMSGVLRITLESSTCDFEDILKFSIEDM